MFTHRNDRSHTKMYLSVLWMMELTSHVVEDQKWVRQGPWSSGFRVHEATKHVLLTCLPCANTLNANPTDPKYFPKTSQWLADAARRRTSNDSLKELTPKCTPATRTAFLKHAKKAADWHSVEVHFQFLPWFTTGCVLRLVTDPKLGLFFTAHLLQAVEKGWGVKPQPARTDSERAVEALFTPKFHQHTHRGFDEVTARIVRKDKTTGKTRTEERRKYGAEVQHAFDFKHELRVYWK